MRTSRCLQACGTFTHPIRSWPRDPTRERSTFFYIRFLSRSPTRWTCGIASSPKHIHHEQGPGPCAVPVMFSRGPDCLAVTPERGNPNLERDPQSIPLQHRLVCHYHQDISVARREFHHAVLDPIRSRFCKYRLDRPPGFIRFSGIVILRNKYGYGTE